MVWLGLKSPVYIWHRNLQQKMFIVKYAKNEKLLCNPLCKVFASVWSNPIALPASYLFVRFLNNFLIWTHCVSWWQRSERCKSERENWMAKCQPFCNYWLTLLPYSILHCGRDGLKGSVSLQAIFNTLYLPFIYSRLNNKKFHLCIHKKKIF